MTVCQAVQHSHQKGIIHRDIKPSNVLVSESDGRPFAKVIDFGLAKAMVPHLTDKTVFTQQGQIIGTVEYMSPEQADLNPVDVDTRTDIYSLGVLLYELLTGETPFDRTRLRSAAFNEILRIIREEEPPRPSIKLSSSESLPSIASNRHCEPKKQACIAEEEADSDDACPCCGLKMTDHHTSHKTTTSHKDEFDLLKVGTRPFTKYKSAVLLLWLSVSLALWLSGYLAL